MQDVLNRSLFLIKEHAGLLRAAYNYDVFDPATGALIMECREENLGRLTRLFRFSGYKRTTPFNLRVRTPDGASVLRVTRGVPVLVSKVKVMDDNDDLIGIFRQRPFSFIGAFDVLDATDRPVCRLKGKLAWWEYRFMGPGDDEFALVTRKWAGIGKELFTSASDYILRIDDTVPQDSSIRQLIFASVLCIGMVQKVELP